MSEKSVVAEVSSILRLHIIGVAMAACVVFSWLMTGEYAIWLALLGGVDWMLINLLNRITDLTEDLVNEIRGTERVAAHKRAFVGTFVVIFVGSFALSLAFFPELTWLRVVVQFIGLAYSLPLIPTPSGWKRFKEIYFLKNFMSSVLFCFTVFLYPLAVADWSTVLPGGLPAVALLIGFFIPFELTYEIIYDLRDLEGDQKAAIPTYPVAHGPHRARQIIDGLLLLSGLVLTAGLATGLLGLREGLMLMAPLIQRAYYRPRYRRGLQPADCIWITHLGTALLLFYVAGNEVWLALDMPANIYLV